MEETPGKTAAAKIIAGRAGSGGGVCLNRRPGRVLYLHISPPAGPTGSRRRAGRRCSNIARDPVGYLNGSRVRGLKSVAKVTGIAYARSFYNSTCITCINTLLQIRADFL